jgi:hypothetical protein
MRPRPRLPTIPFDAEGLLATARTIDRLARLQLAARRAGMQLRVLNPARGLADLLDFAGLREALGVEVERHSEEREESGRVEEEGELRDPPS